MDPTNEIEDAAEAQRRGFLKCMLWAGTGVLWTVSGGVPRSALLGGSAMAATPASGELTFVQMSDSHIGFANPPNTDAPGTLREAIERVGQLKGNSSLMIRPAPRMICSAVSNCTSRDRWLTSPVWAHTI